jgi:hypothetical protein
VIDDRAAHTIARHSPRARGAEYLLTTPAFAGKTQPHFDRASVWPRRKSPEAWDNRGIDLRNRRVQYDTVGVACGRVDLPFPLPRKVRSRCRSSKTTRPSVLLVSSSC